MAIVVDGAVEVEMAAAVVSGDGGVARAENSAALRSGAGEDVNGGCGASRVEEGVLGHHCHLRIQPRRQQK